MTVFIPAPQAVPEGGCPRSLAHPISFTISSSNVCGFFHFQPEALAMPARPPVQSIKGSALRGEFWEFTPEWPTMTFINNFGLSAGPGTTSGARDHALLSMLTLGGRVPDNFSIDCK
jgi:hypothetical protein